MEITESGVILRVRHLSKSYNKEPILKDICFDVRRGETKVIIGPSGTGKSTLLGCLNRRTMPDSGRIWLDGVEVTSPKANINKIRQSIGMVFQDFNLFAHLTALDNVRIGLTKVKKIPKREATELSLKMLSRVGLVDKAGAYPAELSGGQQQRVSIARTLAMQPQLMLFDEPTSALDPELIGEVLVVIKDLVESGMTMVVVSHEMGFARSVCDEIIFIEKGVIVEQGPPDELFLRPKHRRTREFLSKITELYGKSEE